MTRTTQTKMHPVSEVAITLDELYTLVNCLDDEEERNPMGAAFTSHLSSRLLSLWSYWSKRTNDTTGFTLRILR